MEAATADPFLHRMMPQCIGNVSNLVDVADATEAVVAMVGGTAMIWFDGFVEVFDCTRL